MCGSNDNKSSPQNQGVNDLSTEKVIDTPLTPRPQGGIHQNVVFFFVQLIAKRHLLCYNTSDQG